MRVGGEGLMPDVISFNVAISACEKGPQWLEALGVMLRQSFDMLFFVGMFVFLQK